MELLCYGVALILFVVLLILMQKKGWVSFRDRSGPGVISGAANALQSMISAESKAAVEYTMKSDRAVASDPADGHKPGDGDHVPGQVGQPTTTRESRDGTDRSPTN